MGIKLSSFKITIIALWVLLLLIITSIFYLPNNPYFMSQESLSSPSLQHWFGTDNMGRDVFTRTIVAIRNSILLNLSVLFISLILGVFIGILSSIGSKTLDSIIMKILNAFNSIPPILFALTLISVFSKHKSALIITLTIIFAPSFARITRNQIFEKNKLEYVQHAKMMGANNIRIMFIHILPNITYSIISMATVVLTNSIILESAMSYLGVGIQPPEPSLGGLIFEAQSYMFIAPWCLLFPGIFMVILILILNNLGEHIKEK